MRRIRDSSDLLSRLDAFARGTDGRKLGCHFAVVVRRVTILGVPVLVRAPPLRLLLDEGIGELGTRTEHALGSHHVCDHLANL